MSVNIQGAEVNSTDVKSQPVKATAKPLALVQIIFGTPGFGLIRRENQSNLRKGWGKEKGVNLDKRKQLQA